MLNLNEFSETNLERIQRLLKLILDTWELQKEDIEKMERFIQNSHIQQQIKYFEKPPIYISKERLQKEDFTLDGAKTIIRKLYEIRKYPYEVVKKYSQEVAKHLYEAREPLHLLEDDIFFQKKCAEVEGFAERMEKALNEEISLVIIDIERIKRLYRNIEVRLKERQLEEGGSKILTFDSQNGVFSYASRSYRIRDKITLNLARTLWNHRREIDAQSKEILVKRIPFPKSSLAVNIELVGSERDYERNPDIKKKLKLKINNLRTGLKRIKAQAKIQEKKGVQLIIYK